jgi:CBS domain-containing protein
VPLCWLALGSAGRLEQTFSTDQDNAIIFDADEADADQIRHALVPFARAVNRKLDACGFPLCTGNIMAGNPRWCLTLSEWRRALAGWIQGSSPEAMINACTFLDFRPVYGQSALAERLRDRMLAAVADYPLFLHRMADSALETRPPLGTFRDFVYDGSSQFRRTIDLKAAGSRLFCDAARVLGLARGVAQTSTAQRLRAVADTGSFGTESVAGIIDGFHFIHLLRLRNQRGPRRPHVGPNRIYPRDLNELDRQVLKEAFRQARKVQNCLVMEFQQRA